MFIISYLLGILLVIGFYALGETIHNYLLSWLPGSIIGMVLLFSVYLMIGERLVRWVKEGAELFIKYLPLFFVPVPVGILQYENLMSGFGIIFFGLLLFSSFLMILVISYLMNRRERDLSCG